MASASNAEAIKVVKTVDIDDREYNLLARKCTKCSEDHFEVWRWSGTSYSRYVMPPEFKEDDFEDFIKLVDEQLLMAASELIREFAQAISRINSPSGIKADNSFAFRLLEYGRLRASALQKQGLLEAITSDKEKLNSQEQAVRTAFELGVAAAEHRIMHVFEDYIHDGISIAEWRDEGLPRARAERLRQGKRTRKAILNAAKSLYEKNPELVRNDSE
jgi:hypothetical protein